MAIYPRRKSGVLRMVSHNTFWFQGVPFLGDQPPAPQSFVLEGLAAIYGALAPDVLCLQEIEDTSALEWLGERLGMPYVHRPRAGLPVWRGHFQPLGRWS